MPARTLAFLAVLLWLTPVAAAAKDKNGDEGQEPDLTELSLEELLNVPISVASRTATPLRKAPGVVDVISREEIVASGAVDLLDVLLLVPGFAFAVDVQGTVSVGFRGNWGAEGKVLLLVDGLEMNESLYLGLPFGNRLPIEQIQRIEIMRGPGSVIYGGNAELAVINVATRGATDLDGLAIAGLYGQMADGLGRRNLNVYAGHAFANGLAVSVSGLIGQGKRSDQRYRDFAGNEYDLPNRTDPTFVDLGLTWRGLAVRAIWEDYHTTSRDALDVSEPAAVTTDFTSALVEARYEAAIGATLTVTPRLSYAWREPWRVTDVGAMSYYDKTAERWLGGLRLSWNPWSSLDVLVGGEAFVDRARVNHLENVGIGLHTLFNGQPSQELRTWATYGQLSLDHRLGQLVVGARYEHNSTFGGAFVPRVALTKQLGRVHAKLLYNRAFKAPGHENFNLNPDVRPERTTIYELEVGWRPTDTLLLVANGFDLTIEDPIVYAFSGAAEAYLNFPRSGTRGVEVSSRLRTRAIDASLEYSFYTAAGKNEVPLYDVPGNDAVLRGFPPHKLTFAARLRPFRRRLSLNPAAILLGPRYGAVRADATGTPITGQEEPTLLLNLVASYEDLLVSGLEVGVGVYNLLDQPHRFLQPYDSGHAPLPGASRELLLRVAYTRPFD